MAKGITLIMGLNDKEFKKKLQENKKEINETAKNVKAFGENLKLNFDNSKFKNALKEAAHLISQNDQRIKLLKDGMKDLEKQGKIDTKEYKWLQRELNQAEIKARDLKEELKKLNAVKIDGLVNKLQGVGNKMEDMGKKLAPISAMAGAALVGLGKIATSTHKFADELQTASDRLGITAETMQKWNYIAMQTDVSQEELSKGFKNLNGTLAQLATGVSNNATNALKKLGIGASDALKGLDANLDNIIESLLAVENPTERLALANELFGQKVGQSLVPMLNQGRKGLQALKEEFAAAGYMTNDQVKNFANFDNTVNRLKHTLKNLKNQIGVALLPVMQSLADFLQNVIIPPIKKITSIFNKMSNKAKNLIVGLLAALTALAPVLLFGGKLIKMIGGIAKGISLLNAKLLTLLANPIVAIIAAVVIVLIMLYKHSEAFRNSINKLVSSLTTSLGPVLNAIGEVFKVYGEIIAEIASYIGDMLAPVIDILTDTLVPLIKIALMPVILHLKFFAQGLKIMLAVFKPVIQLIKAIAIPIMKKLGAVFKGVGFIVQMVAYGVVKAIEWMVNGVLKIINKILKPVNKVIKFFGGKPIKISESIDISSNLDPRRTKEIQDEANKREKEIADKKGNAISDASRITSNTNTSQTNNNYTTINNNNSNANKIEIKVENYGKEIDADELVSIINAKMAKGGS